MYARNVLQIILSQHTIQYVDSLATSQYAQRIASYYAYYVDTYMMCIHTSQYTYQLAITTLEYAYSQYSTLQQLYELVVHTSMHVIAANEEELQCAQNYELVYYYEHSSRVCILRVLQLMQEHNIFQLCIVRTKGVSHTPPSYPQYAYQLVLVHMHSMHTMHMYYYSMHTTTRRVVAMNPQIIILQLVARVCICHNTLESILASIMHNIMPLVYDTIHTLSYYST